MGHHRSNFVYQAGQGQECTLLNHGTRTIPDVSMFDDLNRHLYIAFRKQAEKEMEPYMYSVLVVKSYAHRAHRRRHPLNAVSITTFQIANGAITTITWQSDTNNTSAAPLRTCANQKTTRYPKPGVNHNVWSAI